LPGKLEERRKGHEADRDRIERIHAHLNGRRPPNYLLTVRALCVTNLSGRTKPCGKKSEDNDVQRHTKFRALGVFFCSKERRVKTTVKKNKTLSGLFVALLFVVTAQSAMAQSTIFNIPTTDTAAKGKVYAEFDFLTQAPAPEEVRTSIYNPRLVVGLSDKAEAGVNFLTAHSSHGAHYCGTSSTCGYVQPNVKFKYYNNDDAGIALSAGILWNAPINQRDTQDNWGYIYTNFSKKVKSGMYGPRITVGPYGVLGANQDVLEGPTSFLEQPRAGAIVGLEQPIHAKASIVADWFSGQNGLGYFTPGISITLPKSGLLNVGYSFGNDSWKDSNSVKNRYFFAYYGVTF
jgi:hypothetical protein